MKECSFLGEHFKLRNVKLYHTIILTRCKTRLDIGKSRLACSPCSKVFISDVMNLLMCVAEVTKSVHWKYLHGVPFWNSYKYNRKLTVTIMTG